MSWNVIEINPEGEWYVVKTCDTHEEADRVARSFCNEHSECDYIVEENT